MSDLPSDPQKQTARNRAYKLRAALKRGQLLTPEDEAWLREYEAAQAAPKSAFAQSSRVFHVEQHDTQGEGDAAVAAAQAAPALAREEGRRIDYLLELIIKSNSTVSAMYERMMDQMLRRNEQLEEVHLSMLDAVRDHYLARIEAEADALASKPEEKPDMIDEMAKGIVGNLIEMKIGKKPA